MRDNVKTLITALRSGKWKKGEGQLALWGTPDLYCCWGVATELDPRMTRGDFGGPGGVYLPIEGAVSDCGVNNYLHKNTMDWLGVACPSPVVEWPIGSDVWIQLAVLNDRRSTTFDEIADILEAQADDWNGVRPT